MEIGYGFCNKTRAERKAVYPGRKEELLEKTSLQGLLFLPGMQ